MKIYVASSWRNESQSDVVDCLVRAGHEVYDFKNPAVGNTGFRWSSIDPDWKCWNSTEFINALQGPIARSGFSLDMNALNWCDACLLVMPCGRSAHLELGYAVGSGKATCILLTDGEPELMYSMVGALRTTLSEAICWANEMHGHLFGSDLLSRML